MNISTRWKVFIAGLASVGALCGMAYLNDKPKFPNPHIFKSTKPPVSKEFVEWKNGPGKYEGLNKPGEPPFPYHHFERKAEKWHEEQAKKKAKAASGSQMPSEDSVEVAEDKPRYKYPIKTQ